MKPPSQNRPLDSAPVQIAMVTAAYGMHTAGYTVPYVARWSTTVEDRDPVEVVRTTGDLVRRTTLAILDRLPKPATGDGAPPGLHNLHAARPADQRLKRHPAHRPHPTTELSLA